MLDSPRSFVAPMATILALTALAVPRSTAQTLPFPMRPTERSADAVVLEPIPGGLEQLAALERVVLTDVPLPGGGRTSLDLRRVLLQLHQDAVWVDGAPDRRGLDRSLSLWRGSVIGQPGSEAFLAFSNHGTRGWFGPADQLHHLLAEPGARGDWSTSRTRLVTEQFVQDAGPRPPAGCQLLTPPGAPRAVPPGRRISQAGGGGTALYDAPIGFETDYEFYALFNDLDAAQAYAFALIGAVGDRYREQNGVIFTLPYVGFHTRDDDPWTTNRCRDRLYQFRDAWRNGGAPVRAQLYHMISGVRVSGCGGIAYVDVICDQGWAFGMSAHINTNLPFPPVQGPLTWDFYVLAHELGHEFGTLHTHDYNPPIDGCASGDCSVVPNGTIMSYCHLCSGGVRNINLRFHPRVVTTIRTAVLNSCLQPFDGVITGDRGYALAGSNGTPTQDVTYSRPSVRIDVASAPLSQVGAVIVGFREALQPFLGGGTLVPRPDVVIPLAIDGAGDGHYSFPVNASYPAGITVWMHSWIYDPGGPNGFAASNATQVELITP